MRRIVPILTREGGTTRLLVTLITLGFLALLVAGVAAVRVVDRNQQHNRWIIHTYDVELATADAVVALERAETARRGYLVTAAPSYLDRYRDAVAAVSPAVERLRNLTLDNERQQARIAALSEVIARLERDHERTNAYVRDAATSEAIRLFNQEGDAQQLRLARGIFAQISTEEKALLTQRDADQRASVNSFFVILTVAAALLLLVAVATFLTVSRSTRSLAASRNDLRNANETLESAVAERTSELSRANDEIQRFAYIVSHDLRSPLVNVMGFTAELEAGTKALAALIDRVEAGAPQLLDDDAKLAAREDLPEAIGFIRTSTAKMDRLINAILKLSREGRRVIAPERIDMVALTGGIRDTLKHRLDETGGEIAVAPDLPPIVSDRIAVDQIFSNVIENAVKYAHPSRPIRVDVRGRTEGQRAVFVITDNGRGIAPADHARIFDLFRRSGAQDQPGEGIGLAHVRALTYRLGGLIEVESELGKGATFTISLPLRYKAASGSGA